MSAIHTAHMTPEQIEEAKRLYGQGLSLVQISRRLGFTGETIHIRIDPHYAQRRRDQINARRSERAEAKAVTKFSPQTETSLAARASLQADRLARLSEIPADTRSLTARICGDPIPGDPRRQRFSGVEA